MSARYEDPDDAVQLTPEQIASARKAARESRQAQGLPEHITDRMTLTLIADLFNGVRRPAESAAGRSVA